MTLIVNEKAYLATIARMEREHIRIARFMQALGKQGIPLDTPEERQRKRRRNTLTSGVRRHYAGPLPKGSRTPNP